MVSLMHVFFNMKCTCIGVFYREKRKLFDIKKKVLIIFPYLTLLIYGSCTYLLTEDATKICFRAFLLVLIISQCLFKRTFPLKKVYLTTQYQSMRLVSVIIAQHMIIALWVHRGPLTTQTFIKIRSISSKAALYFGLLWHKLSS